MDVGLRRVRRHAPGLGRSVDGCRGLRGPVGRYRPRSARGVAATAEEAIRYAHDTVARIAGLDAQFDTSADG